MRRGRPPYPDVLTPREQEVLSIVREGLTNEGIGARLGISEHGAKYHVAEILSKLGVSNRQEAARWSRPQRVAPSLLGLLTRHAAVGTLVVAGIGLIALAAGVLLMNERSGGVTTGSGQQQQQEENLPPPPGVDDGPIRRIAYVEMRGDEGDIWTMNPDGSDKVQLTNDQGMEGSPAWSQDGRRIAFVSGNASANESVSLWVMNADGSGRRLVTTINYGGAASLRWSPDGRRIAFNSSNPSSPNVFVVNVDGSEFKALTNDTRVNGAQKWTSDSEKVIFLNGAGYSSIDAVGGTSSLILAIDRRTYETVEPSSDFSRAVVGTLLDQLSGTYRYEILDTPTGARQMLMDSSAGIRGFLWSPDKHHLAYAQGNDDGSWSIHLIKDDGTEAHEILAVPSDRSVVPFLSYIGLVAWSDDGQYITYMRSTLVARFTSEAQICYTSTAGSQEACFGPRYSENIQDGPSSPSLLLN